MAYSNHEDFAFCVLMLDQSVTDQSIHRLEEQLGKQERTEGYKGDIVVDRVSLEVSASTLMVDEPGLCIVLYVKPATGVDDLKKFDKHIRTFPSDQVFISTKTSVNHTKESIKAIKRLIKHCHLSVDSKSKISGHIFQLEYFNRLLVDEILGNQPIKNNASTRAADNISDINSDTSTCDDSGIASPQPRHKRKQQQLSEPRTVTTENGNIDKGGNSSNVYTQGRLKPSTRATERVPSAGDEVRTPSSALAKVTIDKQAGPSSRNTDNGNFKVSDKSTSNLSARVNSQNQVPNSLQSVKGNKTPIPSNAQRSQSATPSIVTSSASVNKSIANQKAQYEKALSDVKKIPLPRIFIIDGKKTLTVEVGNITKMAVDCIVSASNSKLKISAGVSKAIADVAGKGMHTFCEDYVKQKGQLSETRCVLSKGFNLPAQNIIHAVGPNWKNYKDREPEGYRLLSLTVKRILVYADNNSFTSLAIPAISSGHFGGSPAEVAESIIDTILNTAPILVTLKEIHLVDINYEMLFRFCVRLQFLQGPGINLVELKGCRNGASAPNHAPSTKMSTAAPLSRDNQPSTKDDSNTGQTSLSGAGWNLTNLSSTFHAMDITKNQKKRKSIGVFSLRSYDVMNSKIFVEKGSIVELNVDCVVNAANKKLEFRGGVAKAIAEAAGPKLYRWSEQNIQDNGPLKEGDCTTSPGFDMDCKYIIHALGPTWGDHKKMSTCFDALYETIKNCLAVATKKNCASIAIPALSSGNSGVSGTIVSEAIVQAVWECMERFTTLKEVHLIDMNADILTHIIHSLEQRKETTQRRSRERSAGGGRRRRSSSISDASRSTYMQDVDSGNAGSTTHVQSIILKRPSTADKPTPRPQSAAMTGSSTSTKSKTGIFKTGVDKVAAMKNKVLTNLPGGARPKTSPGSTTPRGNNPLRASHDIGGGAPQATADDKRSRQPAWANDNKTKITRKRSNSMSNVDRHKRN